ncbi:MAG: tyrosine-type recombinase/integrase [Verrucomicrobiales bacterium]
MASLRKKARSQYWFACFTLPDGTRVQRSTKETKRKEAQNKADEWERLSKERAKAKQAQRVIADIYQAAHAAALPNATVKLYLEGWLARRKGEVSPATSQVYENTISKFLAFLADEKFPLFELETSHILAFRDSQALKFASTTVNSYIKHLRIFFEDARRDGFLADNPAKDCPRLKVQAGDGRGKRRPLTVEELRKILDIADEEMKSLILFGLYTGQRLRDLSNLTWANIDTVGGEVQITTAKTGRVVRVPMSAPLLAHVQSLPSSDDPNAHLHPRAAHSTGPANSNRFTDLLANAGLVARRKPLKKDKDDESRKRAPSQLSFHSLRHTATSLMKNAGVSPAIVQDIIGHDSAAMSASYTHIESAAKKKALDSIPDLTAKGV